MIWAQTSQEGPLTTNVLVALTLNSDVRQRQGIGKVMQVEIRETVRLYLDGKISQWYARSDARGVMFILNATSVEEPKAMTETLPLPREGLATPDDVALSPLSPLRMLIAKTAAAP